MFQGVSSSLSVYSAYLQRAVQATGQYYMSGILLEGSPHIGQIGVCELVRAELLLAIL